MFKLRYLDISMMYSYLDSTPPTYMSYVHNYHIDKPNYYTEQAQQGRDCRYDTNPSVRLQKHTLTQLFNMIAKIMIF